MTHKKVGHKARNTAKLERFACRRIATAIRAYAQAPTRGWSMNKLADEWGVPTSTLDVLVGTDKHPEAASIPRGTTLQLIAIRTGYSLDWLLGVSDEPEFRDQTLGAATLEQDVAAHVKRALDAAIAPSVLEERREWGVHGDVVLRTAVENALTEARRLKYERDSRMTVYIRNEDGTESYGRAQ